MEISIGLRLGLLNGPDHRESAGDPLFAYADMVLNALPAVKRAQNRFPAGDFRHQPR
jgi:hypothetical protein